MSKVKDYLSLVKFSHTIFAMPFAMIGFFLGIIGFTSFGLTIVQTSKYEGYTFFDSGHIINPEIYNQSILIKLLLVLTCMVTARSAAMAFNRYLDRSFDAKNPRTAIREIPKGIISANNATGDK